MPLFWERLFDDFTTTRHAAPATLLWIVLIAFGVLFLVVGGLVNAMTGHTSLFALFGFLLLAMGAIAMVADAHRAGGENPRSNGTCPKCGASPEGVVTANGFTKCARCGEPYFVF